MQKYTSTDKNPSINSLRFINSNRHFVACTNEGFLVCDAQNGEKKIQSTVPGGVSICDSYKNSNIFFLVGTGEHIDFPTTKLCLWDCEANKLAGEVQFSPSLQIVDLQIKGDWILVVFKDRCKLFHFDHGFESDKIVNEFLTQPNSSHKSG